MQNPTLKNPTGILSAAARLQPQREQHATQDETGHSRVTTATSTSSYQSGGEYGGGGYSSLASAEYRGNGLIPLEPTDPSQDHDRVQFSAPSNFPGTPGTSVTTDRLATCHRFSRIVRMLAVLDAVVVLCGASAFTPLILMIWGPIAGYLSSNFKLNAAYTFLFYYGLRISWDIGWLLSGGITWIVVWVFLFTDVVASGLVYFYQGALRREIDVLGRSGCS
eukprot:g2334.t2